jgi:hypothetical protein
MSRLKQSQNIDSLIRILQAIKKSQCSHSEEDPRVLDEAINRIELLRKKKGKTNQQVMTEFVKIAELLPDFLKKAQCTEC